VVREPLALARRNQDVVLAGIDHITAISRARPMAGSIVERYGPAIGAIDQQHHLFKGLATFMLKLTSKNSGRQIKEEPQRVIGGGMMEVIRGVGLQFFGWWC
jgi:hypothetical protein